MSFSADWLTLRRAADARARNTEVAGRLAEHFAGRSSVSVLDLGAGNGSNMLLTSSHLPAVQRWTLVDADGELLAGVEPPSGVSCDVRVADLASGVGAQFSPPPDLVTASALFDLCGAEWIDLFVRDLRGAGAPLYAVLSYDGRENWSPPNPADVAVLAAFHADQRGDKGLGASLGPDAHDHLAKRLREAGYHVVEGSSDWELCQIDDAALITALAEGSASVAGHPDWLAARLGASSVRIGHKDLFAWPG